MAKINNIKQLQCFVKLAECLSYKKTAEDLNLSVQSIKKNIKELEEITEKKIFNKEKSEIELTEFGKCIYLNAYKITSNYKNFIKKINEEKHQKHTIHISVSEELSNQVCLTNIIKIFNKHHPNINIFLQEGLEGKKSPIDENYLINFDIFFGYGSTIIKKNSKLFERKLILKTKFCLIASDEYLKKNHQIKNTEDLKKHTIITFPVSKNFSTIIINDQKIRYDSNSTIQFLNSGITNAAYLAEKSAGISYNILTNPIKSMIKNKNISLVLENEKFRDYEFFMFINKTNKNKHIEKFIRLTEKYLKEGKAFNVTEEILDIHRK